MSTTTIDPHIVQEGWNILVEKLGLQKATQFVVLLERGKGDLIKEIQEYWGDASIDEVFQRVNDWRSRQK